MKAQVEIISIDNKELINVDNIINKNHFSYTDLDGASNEIDILDDGIKVHRISKDHETNLYLSQNERSFIEIKTEEGVINIDTKTLAFNVNNDIISIAYIIDGSETNKIVIKYIGA